MFLVFLMVLACYVHWTRQHLTYPINYCNMASTCIHDNRLVCASTPEGCSRRQFLDQCDMYEYNCDYGTRYKETYILYCISSDLEIQILDQQIPKKTESMSIIDYKNPTLLTTLAVVKPVSSRKTKIPETTLTEMTTIPINIPQPQNHTNLSIGITKTILVLPISTQTTTKPTESTKITDQTDDTFVCCDRPKTWETTIETTKVIEPSGEEYNEIVQTSDQQIQKNTESASMIDMNDLIDIYTVPLDTKKPTLSITPELMKLVSLRKTKIPETILTEMIVKPMNISQPQNHTNLSIVTTKTTLILPVSTQTTTEPTISTKTTDHTGDTIVYCCDMPKTWETTKETTKVIQPSGEEYNEVQQSNQQTQNKMESASMLDNNDLIDIYTEPLYTQPLNHTNLSIVTTKTTLPASTQSITKPAESTKITNQTGDKPSTWEFTTETTKVIQPSVEEYNEIVHVYEYIDTTHKTTPTILVLPVSTQTTTKLAESTKITSQTGDTFVSCCDKPSMWESTTETTKVIQPSVEEYNEIVQVDGNIDTTHETLPTTLFLPVSTQTTTKPTESTEITSQTDDTFFSCCDKPLTWESTTETTKIIQPSVEEYNKIVQIYGNIYSTHETTPNTLVLPVSTQTTTEPTESTKITSQTDDTFVSCCDKPSTWESTTETTKVIQPSVEEYNEIVQVDGNIDTTHETLPTTLFLPVSMQTSTKPTESTEITSLTDDTFVSCCDKPLTWESTTETTKIIQPSGEEYDEIVQINGNIGTTHKTTPDFKTTATTSNKVTVTNQPLTTTLPFTNNQPPAYSNEETNTTPNAPKYDTEKNPLKDHVKNISSTFTESTTIPSIYDNTIRCNRPKTWETTTLKHLILDIVPNTEFEETPNTATVKDYFTTKPSTPHTATETTVPNTTNISLNTMTSPKTTRMASTTPKKVTSSTGSKASTTPKTVTSNSKTVQNIASDSIVVIDYTTTTTESYKNLKFDTKASRTSTWWYPKFCKSGRCNRPITWYTTKGRRSRF